MISEDTGYAASTFSDLFHYFIVPDSDDGLKLLVPTVDEATPKPSDL